MNIHLDTQFLKAEINKLIDANPELAEDETLLEDMLDGETDLKPVLSKLVSKRNFAQAMSAAAKEVAANASERSARFGRQADSLKALAHSILDAAGLQKITLPEATLSISKARTFVNITDINELPQGTFTTERKADKATLKRLLEAGETIPGAELVMGDETLTVRCR